MKRPPSFLLLLALSLPPTLSSDEGLWLFNQFPKQAVKKAYGVDVSDSFLERLRLASVRFGSGGSGSFVSAQGLLFTNHHVGSDCIQKLSTAEHDYMANGLYAATQAEEKTCPGLEVDVLLKIEDVTQRVKESAGPELPTAEQNRLRKAAMTRLEEECGASTGNRCEAVSLYSGGLYHLYQYKKYTDVRLVFAPEVEIAAFGGDPDNFTYPRYCLDFAFFRAYENGQPAAVREFLPWTHSPLREGMPVFVSGHPGTTGRLLTVAQLEFFRDVSYPLVLRRLESLIAALEAYGAKSPENSRIARDNLFSQQNSFKAYTGFLKGLRDPDLMKRKRRDEERLRAAVRARPALQQQYGGTWEELAKAYQGFAGLYKHYWLLEANAARGSDLTHIARLVLRYAEEKAKPNEQRLRAFVDPALPSVEREMYSPAPIEDSMEVAVLTNYLRFLEKELGTEDPTVKELLGGATPEQAAERYVHGSKLKDVAERKRLAGSLEAVRNSGDGMIRFVRILDGPARSYRKQYEDRVEAVVNAGASKIAQARFSISGAKEYPDATSTLRLTYGAVKGYRDSAGRAVPYTTRLEGLYRRATGKEPFRLPPSWVAAKAKLDLMTPFNFVTTTDTHGGNSGSPTVNAKGEVIGILFDGNLEGLPNRFVFTDRQARSVHVSTLAITEALKKVYQARRLLGELGLAAE